MDAIHQLVETTERLIQYRAEVEGDLAKQQQSAQMPSELKKWVRGVFARCNKFTTAKLSEIPNTHEPWLDHSLIESLNREPVPSPKNLGGWSAYIQTHFLGGRAMFENFEVADIGVLVTFRSAGNVLRTKVALLQSKRLYADEIKAIPPIRQLYEEGFYSLALSSSSHSQVIAQRAFHFTQNSLYRAYANRGGQEKRVAEYESQRQIPVYYLLYNPHAVPWTVSVPLAERKRLGKPLAGCRVVPAADLRSILQASDDGVPLQYGDLARLPGKLNGTSSDHGWRLEDFIVDQLLSCKGGYVPRKPNDENLEALFFRRSGPIMAAIGITVDAPDGVEFALPERTE